MEGNGLLLVLAALLLIGLGVALLLLWNRLQREQLEFNLRLEQAEKTTQQLEEDSQRLRTERDALRLRKEELEGEKIRLEGLLHENQALAEERQNLLEQSQQRMEEEFNNLSRKVMAEQGRLLREQHVGGLENLLQPVREQLGDFRRKIEEVHHQESRDRVALIKEIEHLKSLNERISREAVDLTKALQGTNKLQGQWGEMVLERLLEESGLRPGKEFAAQVSIRDEQGKLKQPDILVYLPESKVIVIDSKVSLNSYVEACRAAEEREREEHLKSHVASVQKHVANLSGKQYQQLPGLTTLDFVLLFIPVEGAFQAVVAAKPELLGEGLRRRVMLASPSTLLAILRTVHHIWRVDEQNRNSQLIAKDAGKLYDKIAGFVEAFAEIGTRLKQARESWELAEKRLHTGQGNLISRAEALKNLGVQTGKDLPIGKEQVE
ncbi:DNA recombination protein RmuC [Candidatus Electronema sp. PJ]|uniref:DNA recombination protein RmuC n=1 Tax=Candidatus Electronema sp. PJ TaxID=3401572 RepID=UPI003AA7C870